MHLPGVSSLPNPDKLFFPIYFILASMSHPILLLDDFINNTVTHVHCRKIRKHMRTSKKIKINCNLTIQNLQLTF